MSSVIPDDVAGPATPAASRPIPPLLSPTDERAEIIQRQVVAENVEQQNLFLRINTIFNDWKTFLVNKQYPQIEKMIDSQAKQRHLNQHIAELDGLLNPFIALVRAGSPAFTTVGMQATILVTFIEMNEHPNRTLRFDARKLREKVAKLLYTNVDNVSSLLDLTEQVGLPSRLTKRTGDPSVETQINQAIQQISTDLKNDITNTLGYKKGFKDVTFEWLKTIGFDPILTTKDILEIINKVKTPKKLNKPELLLNLEALVKVYREQNRRQQVLYEEAEKLKGEVLGQNARKNLLQTELTQAKEQIEDLKEILQELQEQVDNSQDLDTYSQDNAELRRTIAALEQAALDFDQQTRAVQEENEQVTSANTELRRRLELVRSERDSIETERDQIENEMTTLRQRIEELVLDNERISQQRDDAETELTALQTTGGNNQAEINRLNDILTQLTTELERNQAEKNQITQDLETMTNEVEALNQRFVGLVRENQNLQDTLNSTNEDFAALQGRYRQLYYQVREIGIPSYLFARWQALQAQDEARRARRAQGEAERARAAAEGARELAEERERDRVDAQRIVIEETEQRLAEAQQRAERMEAAARLAARRAGPLRRFIGNPSAEARLLLDDVFASYLDPGPRTSFQIKHRFFMTLSYNGTQIFSGPVYQPEGIPSEADRGRIEDYINNPYASAEGKTIFDTFAQHFERSEGWEWEVTSEGVFRRWVADVWYPTLNRHMP